MSPLTRDQESGKLALFVDGQLAGENTGSKRPLTTPEDLVIGRSRPGGAGFRGDLDELTFYDRALSAAEVASLALDLPGGVAAAVGAEVENLHLGFEAEELVQQQLELVDAQRPRQLLLHRLLGARRAGEQGCHTESRAPSRRLVRSKTMASAPILLTPRCSSASEEHCPLARRALF